ncbi:A-kinase anchor protein 1, mitochondrial [Rousettus aegyptiacus]|uniref:A-kinase anchoring protein 1 n=1 Tax=Rousettus aegyptiacus TaxID=9407 RepID=A0A7J8G592_ROUAE|nr:A-kinase anchor protein 1, mitochondrial [Rousettus aegyptiacus]XP_016010500.2 A-kinase anchor protein 1, mitochondrial [Rousettus aegyptiacus]XP_016010516.2 A-kinase anchor protein 1, mitochondrial [Rousettus aegyptiacus]XP_036078625.1 A-kinase anchor protein 1, mitochondrial [Rousettus aegyptiacus]XP_036078626.1 A-kinase anchor protein 1, mitochondrial [Rousettus aegyptiacus]KAF6454592.1 A-kinase anchoring protein 1 [Rousettus aegyptiacus]
MAIQFRSLFPLALPGMLALLGWWWFFSRKKEHVRSRKKRVEAGGVELRARPAPEEPVPVADDCSGAGSTSFYVTQTPEKEPATPSEPGAELSVLWIRPACLSSESSGSLPNTTDTRFQPGTRKDDSTRVEVAVRGDEDTSVLLECSLPSPKAVPFPHKAAEVCKHEAGQGRQGPSAAPTEKHGPGEKARETGGAEGTGDAVSGESVLEEGVLSQEHGCELQCSKVPSLAPLGGGGEERKSSLPQVEGDTAGKLLSSFTESAHVELAKDDETLASRVRGSRAWDGDVLELGKEETLDGNEEIEQVAFQIISKVILEATEEVLATTIGEIAGHMGQASGSQLQGQEEESCASVSQKTASGQGAVEPTLATVEVASGQSDAALPPPYPPAEDLPPPKTYVSCLTSPLSSPTKDGKPKSSVHHISLAPYSPPAGRLRGSLDSANFLVEDACMSDNSQSVSSMASSGQCSDSISTSGLEDSCTETNYSPKDKATTLLLSESTVPFSNGVLKGELSDLGTEDGWTVDAEADHSGGSDGNSMDSVDGCCGLRKTDGFQNTQTGSSPKKVDLIIWEIEVPKHLVGRLIGKQGRYVSFLKQTSGAKIYISTLPYTQNIQICHIEGSQHHVDKALNLIGKKFKELNLTNIYAPPLPSLALPSLPMTSWLMLPDGVTVEVIVVNQVSAGHLFVQQHTHPTFHALRSLDQQMYLCYSQPGIPTLPTPVEITVICAAPGVDGAWWRAQVVAAYEETSEVEIRYVDYGGYKRVKVDVLRQIRSDFVTLPFQGAEVLLDSVMPLSDDDHFSPEANAAMSEMTGNTALLAQVTNYSPTGLPLIQLWSVVGDEVVLINRSLVERGLAQWVDSYYTSL